MILAAGRGTRMRAPQPQVELDEAQRRAAARGLKPLIPFHGHPYLSYVLTAVADAGFHEACLVVGPGSDPVRERYEGAATRLRLRFAVQPEPRGGADALLRAEAFASEDPFAVLNADNYYPAPALARLHGLDGPGLVAFRRDALVSRSNIPEERVAAFALVTPDADGWLEAIVEKPDSSELARGGPAALVSMTCWRFGPAIFEACRAIAPSKRGELELPDAVTHAIRRLGERFRVVVADEPVLDLGSRADIPSVAEALRGVRVDP